ncbi:hypothetical protein [Methylobacterium oryzisoli]|uniref:hypothetical protein n=1 Tax=Methylobacterium oryzisoli TaxID=3385502 RepID=UPI00389271B5
MAPYRSDAAWRAKSRQYEMAVWDDDEMRTRLDGWRAVGIAAIGALVAGSGVYLLGDLVPGLLMGWLQ